MSNDTANVQESVPTDQLLTWASGLKFADLPDDAVEMLKDDLVDGLGCGLFGSTLPAIRVIREALLEQSGGNAGPCLLWGTATRTSALDAVVINAAGQNGFELDDYCGLVRGVHGSATVYPAILAVSELTHTVSGEDLMAAAAAGWEASTRMSMAMGPTVLDRGWYVTPIYTTLGSAVAAGRALHFDAERMRTTFELALLHASGLAVTSEEGMGKPLSTGEAVRSGLLCALLAAKGGRGPRHAYDHRKGFAAAFSTPGERNDDALVVRPGDPLACQNVRFKAYASCGAAQVVTDILSDIMQADLAIGPTTVESVELRINRTSAGHVGAPYFPTDVTNAQFNLAYCVAAQILEGDNSAKQFRRELLADRRILELTRRVQVVPDPQVGSRSDVRNEAFVTVRLKSGRMLEGHAEATRKLDRARIRTKFSGLASSVMSADAQAKVLVAVDDLEHQQDTAVLTRLLSAN